MARMVIYTFLASEKKMIDLVKKISQELSTRFATIYYNLEILSYEQQS